MTRPLTAPPFAADGPYVRVDSSPDSRSEQLPPTNQRRRHIVKKQILVAVAAVLALGFTASSATAQCMFAHPKKAGKLSASLTQAFVSCNNPGGNSLNATTEGGIPSCGSPETFHQQIGSPGGGWLWGPSSKGDVSFKAAKNKIINPINPADNTADVAIQVKVSGILDDIGPANGSGVLATVLRMTIDDRFNGDMTILDFPAGFPLLAVNGKISKKTSLNVLLNGLGQPGLPKCSSIEFVSANVNDPNGNAFATIGVFLPQ